MTVCKDHGKLEEKVSNLEKGQDILIQGQSKIIELLTEERINQPKTCRANRDKLEEDIINELGKDITKVKDTVEDNKEAIKPNTDMRKNAKWYLAALCTISGVLITCYKLFV